MPGSYKPLMTETALPVGPAPGRHGQVVLQGQPSTRADGPAQSHWSGTDSILLRPEISVPDQVFRRHKAGDLLKVGEHMASLKGETLSTLLEGKGKGE